MNRPLMPKATALWLITHTQLTHKQISQFCMLHPLEINVIVESRILQESNPILIGQLTSEEIARCESDPSAELMLKESEFPSKKIQKQYTPLSKRDEIPHAILWIVKHYPQLPDAKVCKLLPTTKNMVKAIREGTHRNSKILAAKDPIFLGLCTQELLSTILVSEGIIEEDKVNTPYTE